MKKLLFLPALLLAAQIVFSQANTQPKSVTAPMAQPTQNMSAAEYYNQGTSYLRRNELQKAEEYLLKAVELDNEFVDALDHLALVYRRRNNLDKAEAVNKQSISIKPDNTVPYINLAVIYKMQNRLEDARQMYLQAQKIDPENPEPYYGIGLLYYSVDSYDTANSFFRIAAQKYDAQEAIEILDAYKGIAYCEFYLENWPESLKFFEAISIFMDEPDIKSKLELLREKVKKE